MTMLSLCGPRTRPPTRMELIDARAGKDPTRTYYLRARMRAEGARRWQLLARTIRQALIEHDLLGLRGVGRLPHGDKTEGFGAWLREELRHKVFGGDGGWLRPYVQQAAGIAQKRAHELAPGAQHDPARPAQMETLAISELQGIVEAAQQQITRAVTHAMLANATPMQTANAASAVINTMRKRTNAMSEWVIAKTHATTTLSAFRARGVRKVGIEPERKRKPRTVPKLRDVADARRRRGPGSRTREETPSPSTLRRIEQVQAELEEAFPSEVDVLTAGDNDVCEECQDISDEGPYDLDEAEDLIPAHPWCRCAFVPAGTLEDALDYNPYHEPAGSSTGGRFTSAEAGGGGPLDPKVTEVGGDAWNKQTAVRLEREYQQAKPELEKLATAAVEGKVAPAPEEEEEQPYVPESWDELSNDKQEEIKNDWMQNTYNDFMESEVNNWYENGDAMDDTKAKLAYEFDGHSANNQYLFDALNELRQEREEAREAELPFSNEQLIDALKADYETGYEGTKDVDLTWDDDKLGLPKGWVAEQGTLPGIEPEKPASKLTPEMREAIEGKLVKAFNDQAEKKVGDAEPPSYLGDSVSEYQDMEWDSKSDKEKFKWAVNNGNIEGADEPAKVPETRLTKLPDKFDPLGERDTTQDYKLTKLLGRQMSVERTADLLVQREIFDKRSEAVAAAHNFESRVWDAWKNDSASATGLALQAATAEELGGRFRSPSAQFTLPKIFETSKGYMISGSGSESELAGKWFASKPEAEKALEGWLEKNPRTAPTLADHRNYADDHFASAGGWDGLKAYVRAKWETSQYLLDKANTPTVDVYRGILLKDKGREQPIEVKPPEFNLPLHYTQLPEVPLNRNGAQSTTTDESVANKWKGVGALKKGLDPEADRVVFRVRAPRTAVLSLPAFGQNLAGEHEVVLAGTAWNKWDAWHGRAPKFEDKAMDWLRRLLDARRKIKPVDLTQIDYEAGQHWLAKPTAQELQYRLEQMRKRNRAQWLATRQLTDEERARYAPGEISAHGGEFAPSHGGPAAPLQGSQGHEATISSRNVTAIGRSADERAKLDAERLKYKRVDVEGLREDEKLAARNVGLFKDSRFYPGMRPDEVKGKSTEAVTDAVRNRMAENLTFLANEAKAGRFGSPQDFENWRHWYEGAHKVAEDEGNKHGISTAAASGVIAALSPQNEWNTNVYQAQTLMDTLSNKRDMKWDGKMDATADRIWKGAMKAELENVRGKTLRELEGNSDVAHTRMAMWVRTENEAHSDRFYREVKPDGTFGDYVRTLKGALTPARWKSTSSIANAVAAFRSGGDHRKLSDAMGEKHKVRSFYNNILDPNSKNGDVTIDTHAVGAAWLYPSTGLDVPVVHALHSTLMKAEQPEGWRATGRSAITGVSGTYAVYADAYRQAARGLGIQPRELQSITWEAKRHLFSAEQTGPKVKAAVGEVWRGYNRGKLTLPQARQEVLRVAKETVGQDAWEELDVTPGQRGIIAIMRKHGIPITRDNYIEAAFSPIPDPWTSEDEAELPEFLQEGWDAEATDYDPDQPRVPAGQPGGGRFGSAGGEGKGDQHPGKGYSAEARVDKHGVIHTSSVYDAQLALFQDRKVELNQPKQVSTLIKLLGKTAADMEKHGEKAPVFNLCNVSIPGTNLFCAESKGIPRVEMPVIPAKQTKDFIDYLKSQGYGVEKGREYAANLRSTQNEIDGAKVAKSMARIKEEGFYKRIVVSRDDYILDGHHTWAGQLGVDAKNNDLHDDKSVKIARVDISITKLLEEGNKWTKAHGITKKAAGQDAMLDFTLLWDEGWLDAGPEDEPRDLQGRWTASGEGKEAHIANLHHAGSNRDKFESAYENLSRDRSVTNADLKEILTRMPHSGQISQAKNRAGILQEIRQTWLRQARFLQKLGDGEPPDWAG